MVFPTTIGVGALKTTTFLPGQNCCYTIQQWKIAHVHVVNLSTAVLMLFCCSMRRACKCIIMLLLAAYSVIRRIMLDQSYCMFVVDIRLPTRVHLENRSYCNVLHHSYTMMSRKFNMQLVYLHTLAVVSLCLFLFRREF